MDRVPSRSWDGRHSRPSGGETVRNEAKVGSRSRERGEFVHSFVLVRSFVYPSSLPIIRPTRPPNEPQNRQDPHVRCVLEVSVPCGDTSGAGRRYLGTTVRLAYDGYGHASHHRARRVPAPPCLLASAARAATLRRPVFGAGRGFTVRSISMSNM